MHLGIRQPAGFRDGALEPVQIRTLACLQLGGRAQKDADAVANDIAIQTGASLTVLAAHEYVLEHPIATWLWPNLRINSRLPPRAVQETTARGRDLPARDVGSVTTRALRERINPYDLVIAPAEATYEGSSERSHYEWLGVTVSGAPPILRVRRRPLAVRQVLMVLDSTPACRTLAQCYLRLSLWSDARLIVLPIDRPSVADFLQDALQFLRRHRERVGVLRPLDLNFEREDLETLLQPFQAAVVGHLSRRVGLYFGAVRNHPFQIVAERVPLVLLP